MEELPKPEKKIPFMTVKIEPEHIFESVAITDPAELAKYRREPSCGDALTVVSLGVFESIAITDPNELARYHREPDDGVARP